MRDKWGGCPPATSRWTPNKTSRPSNATWRTLLTTFLPEKQAPDHSHVALEHQHDIALPQCDVAPCFWTFFAQKPGSPPQPRRVGAPTRHGAPPTDGQHLEDLLYLTRGKQLYMEDGSELYIDPSSPTGTLHNQYEPGFVPAREKSPLELLIENKDLLD